jgi:hypothetical protein
VNKPTIHLYKENIEYIFGDYKLVCVTTPSCIPKNKREIYWYHWGLDPGLNASAWIHIPDAGNDPESVSEEFLNLLSLRCYASS